MGLWKFKNIWKLIQVRTFVCIILISIPSFFITFLYTRTRSYYIPVIEENTKIGGIHKKYLINTSGCKIPDFPVFSNNIDMYFEYEYDGAHCNEDWPPLVQSNLTSLFLVESSFVKYKITNITSLQCCHEELKRKIPDGQEDHQYEFGDICLYFEKSIEVKEEFVRVKCRYVDEIIYEDFFAFIPPKYNKTSFAINQQKENVLIIGIDGVSRLNFHRQMQKSVGFLEKLDFIEFLGYNKIADNTYPNLITVLTGENEETIDRTCKNSTKYYDKCGFIWNDFKAANYTTSFGEDAASIGIFNYKKYGFQKQPTDYMWGFFNRISEHFLGYALRGNIFECIGPREVYKMFVQYIHDFVSQMELWKLPYFAFFWGSSLSHDELNQPRIGDEVYHNFLKIMHDKGYFENTVVIIMSDHGIRYGPFRRTYQGRIEERLPILFIRLPEEFKKRYPAATSNFKQNSRMLTTPYDLHETLYDISSPKNLIDDFIEKQRRKSKSQHGLSLFHKIEPTRTCKDAGIAIHWCTCLDNSPVEADSKVIEMTKLTIYYMNEMLKEYEQCENLRLKDVTDVLSIFTSQESEETEEKIETFLINFRTLPGDGLFEATVSRRANGSITLHGSISRLNFYGNQSSCINNFHLKLYCYCKEIYSVDIPS